MATIENTLKALVESARTLADPEIAEALASVPNHVNEFGFDPWGFSPREAPALFTIGKRIYDYFRPSIHGIENIPEGRVLLVANHSGQLPLDGIVIAIACLLRAKPPRLVRAMVERWFPRVPYINEALARAGAVLGDPINCANLLRDDQAILVFPEGTKGSGKTWRDRYHLMGFGRGFMRLALQTDAPIVPIGVVGGEESIISIHNWTGMARLLGLPYFPIPPHLPIAGLLAYFPLPVKFHVYFGEPMRFSGRFDDEDAAIDEKVAQVEARVRALIKEGLQKRGTIF
jgi:1-acyl-sn-glycerol-3-phosphate acyltransferase